MVKGEVVLQQLDKLKKEWKEKLPDMKYFLVVYQDGKEPLVSYAKDDMTILVEPYNVPEEVELENLTPRELIMLELSEEGQVGAIYELIDDEYIPIAMGQLEKGEE